MNTGGIYALVTVVQREMFKFGPRGTAETCNVLLFSLPGVIRYGFAQLRVLLESCTGRWMRTGAANCLMNIGLRGTQEADTQCTRIYKGMHLSSRSLTSVAYTLDFFDKSFAMATPRPKRTVCQQLSFGRIFSCSRLHSTKPLAFFRRDHEHRCHLIECEEIHAFVNAFVLKKVHVFTSVFALACVVFIYVD